MTDAYDDLTLIPSELDRFRLEDLLEDSRYEAENSTWVVLRYPEIPIKGWRWCAYTLIVNHPHIPPRMAELKNLKAVMAYLGQLESERRLRKK